MIMNSVLAIYPPDPCHEVMWSKVLQKGHSQVPGKLSGAAIKGLVFAKVQGNFKYISSMAHYRLPALKLLACDTHSFSVAFFC